MVLVSTVHRDLIKKYIHDPADVFRYVSFLLEKPSVNIWRYFPVEHSKKGVTIYNPEKTWGDYTFFAHPDEMVLLVDMDGDVVYKWDTDFPEEHITLMNDKPYLIRAFPDPADPRNIYTAHFSSKDFMVEYGMSKYDGASNLLWHSGEKVTHDMDFIDSGSFVSLAVRLRLEDHPGLTHLSPPYLENFVVVMTPDGEVQKRISLLDAFHGTDYQGVLDDLELVPDDENYRVGDFFHPNTVTVVPAEFARQFPKISDNSVMLSFRNLDMIVFVDMQTEKVTWAFYGPWRGQHNTRFLENGNIIMFDNQGHLGEGGRSRVLEYDLKSQKIVWQYTGTAEQPFYSVYNGMIDILPNGNFLVTETHSGRIFEVTRGKEVVWEYYASKRVQYDGETRIPSLVNARRFTKDEVAVLLSDKD